MTEVDASTTHSSMPSSAPSSAQPKPQAPSSVPLTLPAMMAASAAAYADKPAIIDADTQLSYAELDSLRWRAAAAFAANGLEKGDRIALWAPNSWEWIVAAIGAQTLGLVVVTVNNRLSGPEAADIIARSGAKLLFTAAQLEKGSPATMLAEQDLPHLARSIVIREGGSWDAFMALGEQAISENALGEGTDLTALQARAAAVTADDAMDMLFTSGTTGKPKGVVCSHQQNIRAFDEWSRTVGLRDDDRYLIINPFFHSFGYKAGWLAAFIRGCTVYPVAAFDPLATMQQIQDDRITMLPGAPSLYEMLLAHPQRSDYDLSSLRLGVTGAAAVPVKLVEDMWQLLGFETVVTAYGLTESSGVVSICRPGDSAETIANTSGRAIDGVELMCADPNTGAEVPRGSEGELWVRGYNVMLEYFEMPEATADAITDDGWLRTGDIGVMDEQGYIRITDRLKDMYIMNGENVYPAEIEKCVYGLEGVAQVAVIGVPKAPQGEVGMAFVVRKPDAAIDTEAVVEHCKAGLARYKVPFYVEFVDALPMNASGKVVKPELKALAKQLLPS